MKKPFFSPPPDLLLCALTTLLAGLGCVLPLCMAMELTSSWGLLPPMSFSLGRWKMFLLSLPLARDAAISSSSKSLSLLKAPMLMVITWMELLTAKFVTAPSLLES